MGYNTVHSTRRVILINMKKYIQLFVFSLFVATLSAAILPSSHQVIAAPDCNQRFLTIPPWYRGLTTGADCKIVSPSAQAGPNTNNQSAPAGTIDIRVFFQILAINIVEILLHITAYVTIAFIIVGGFKYITSAGSPDGNQKGRTTITNAVIGLIISIVSIGIVNFIINGIAPPATGP